MAAHKTEHTVIVCQVCKKRLSRSNGMPLALVNGPVAELIRNQHPELAASGFICRVPAS